MTVSNSKFSEELYSQMLELSPICTMMCDTNGILIYMNKASIDTLKTLEKHLPDKVDKLVGNSIDWFHKNPKHQQNIVGSEKNLPLRSVISVAEEKLDLLVSPVTLQDGSYAGAMVSWSVVTEQLAKEEENNRMAQMLEMAPINIMVSDPQGKLLFSNKQSRDVLKTLQEHIPVNVEKMVGESIDIFHKNPEHQRKIVGDERNLPHKAVISLGGEKLNLNVNALYDQDRVYIGPMVTWDIVTEKVDVVASLKENADKLSSAASSLLQVSSSLSSSVEETSAQANTASVASEEVNAGVQTVASNMEEMTFAIKEITKTTNESSSMSNSAMKMAHNTNEIIGKLGESSMDIGNVIKVISSIAQQTNLLALNATIEAARAGEAGKGFGVVANEVKELAKQTAKATADITKKIETIQSDSKDAVGAIGEISEAVEKLNGFAGNIAASVEEQAATTNEVSRIITESAEGVTQINENISQVSTAAAITGKDANSAQESAKNLELVSSTLLDLVKKIEV